MTKYGIRRVDNKEVLPEPYRYDSLSEAVIGLEELMALLDRCDSTVELKTVQLSDGKKKISELGPPDFICRR